MKTVRLVILFSAVALLAGCVVGPTPERLVIETGAAQPGESPPRTDRGRADASAMAPDLRAGPDVLKDRENAPKR